MKKYESDRIRNVALMGHSGSGKTTLAETMLFEAGALSRRGTVEESNTVSDYHDVEMDRGNSVFGTLLHAEWRDHKINIVDTPGYDDFVGEVLSALRVVDTGIMVLAASDGVQVGTELIWQQTVQLNTPMIFAVNKLDHDKSNFEQTVEQAKDRFGRSVTVVQYPLNEGGSFNTIVDVLKMTVYKFSAEGGKPEKLPIPAEEKEKAEQLHNELIESIAENDEGLMELYFEKGTLDEDEMRAGLKAGLMKRQIFPLFCVCGRRNMGSGRLMGFIDNVAPAPADMPPKKSVDGSELPCDSNGPLVLFVYKTLSEAHVGEMAYFRVSSGKLHSGMDLVNQANGGSERVTHFFAVNGKKRQEIDELYAGDLGATVKLKDTHANQTLHEKGKPIAMPAVAYPSSKVRTAIRPANAKEEEKLAASLHRLHKEDPTLIVEHSQELRQTILHGQGELHFTVVKWSLEHRFGVQAEFIPPRISYRETIQRSTKGHYKHKKQTGGAGQYGEVYMVLEPYTEGMAATPDVNVRHTDEIELEWGGKLVYQNCIVGGVIDQRFLPAILKGIMDKMENGPLTGCYVRDIRVSIYDGSMHSVDSNEAAFKTAALMAFRDAFAEGDPKILEPIFEVEVIVPDEYVGDVMSDLPSRRATIIGIDADGHYQRIKAKMPQAELDGYSTALRAMTQGRATYSGSYDGYAPVPHDLQDKLIAAHKKSEEDA